MKKKWIEKTVILTAVLGVLFLFAFFLRDIMVPLFSMELNNDVDGARALLTSRGVSGGAAVSLIEALQMVVVFIPAEFIQVSAGLSYPFYIAMLLCDIGVCLGASIIYILVRTFRFSAVSSRKTKEQIESMSALKGGRNTQMLMYLLFITPIIPFGAICYYASSTDIRYRRYIMTVATGVIPSIITSNLIGTGVRAFIMNSLPLWVLLLIILFMMGVLFVLLWLFLDKVYFRGKDGTPDSAAWFVVMKIASLWRRHCQRLTVDDEKIKELKAPFVLLCNHVSFYDFYYVLRLLKAHKPSFVVNHHVCSAPVLRHLSGKAGMIPKKMFYPDTAAIKLLRTLRAGYPVVVFPEGRLSIDGRGSAIVESAAKLYKKAGVPLVLAHISGGYFTCPKWRGRFFRGDVHIAAQRVLTPEELSKMSVEMIEQTISQAMTYNASDAPLNRFDKKSRARGLHNMLYRCADCGALYTTKSRDNELYCTACGKSHHLDEYCRFTDEIGSIPGYCDRIKALERETLDSVHLRTEADVKIFSDKKPHVRREKGVCTLSNDAFTYHSDKTDFSIPTERIPALAFSCGSEFELYYQGEQYYFYPTDNGQQTARWSLLIDLFREERISRE